MDDSQYMESTEGAEAAPRAAFDSVTFGMQGIQAEAVCVLKWKRWLFVCKDSSNHVKESNTVQLPKAG